MAYGAGVLTVATGDFLTVADDVKVMIVNLDRGTTYESSMAEAIMYANGWETSTFPPATSAACGSPTPALR